MAHPPTLGRGLSGDEGDYRFLKVLLYIFSGLFFGGAADFTNHDDRLGRGVSVEQRERIDVTGADDWIAADPDTARLPDAEQCQLMHRLVGERSRARDHPHVARLVDVT